MKSNHSVVDSLKVQNANGKNYATSTTVFFSFFWLVKLNIIFVDHAAKFLFLERNGSKMKSLHRHINQYHEKFNYK
jgi:hypothetical protein